MTAFTATVTEAVAAADTPSGLTYRITLPTNNQPAPISGTPPSAGDAANKMWVRRIAEVLNQALAGKVNIGLYVMLNANATSTTVTDARIGRYSALIPLPVTASAAAVCYETPYILPSSQNTGSVVLNHGNTAATDKLILLVILG